MAIRRPTNYDATADIIADLEDMADSIQDELDLKVDKVQGKGLSTNDYTTEEKEKLSGIEEEANKTVVDVSLDETSENPVQNKAIYAELEAKQAEIDTLVEENSTMKKQIPTEHISTTSIQLTDSAEGLPVENVKLKGGTSQEQYEGNQLVDFSNGVVSNVTYSFQNDTLEVIGIADRGYNSVNYNVTDLILNNTGKTLKFVYESLNNSNADATTRIQLAIYLTDETKQYVNMQVNTYSIPNDVTNIDHVILGVYQNNSATSNPGTLTIVKPMLQFGTDTKTFEPFVGGQASPSPAYPQTIHTVTGDCEVEVVNKNRIRLQDGTYTVGTDSIEVDNGIVKVKGNFTNAKNFYIPLVDDITLKNGETNTFSASVINSIPDNKLAIRLLTTNYATDINSFGNSYSGFINNTAKKTYTQTSNQTFRYVLLYISANTTNLDCEISYQLEKSDTATAYTPHAEQNAPLSLGNIEAYEGDEIEIDYVQKAGYKKVTGARLVQNMGEYDFTGEETFTKSTSTNNVAFYTAMFSPQIKAADSNNYAISMYSNCFISYSANKIFGQDVVGVSVSTTKNVQFGLGANSEITTVEAFQQMLAQKNVSLVYPLETPTTTEITDPTLLAQFETFINMKTYKDITNIDCTGEDLAPILDCDYYQDMSTVKSDIASIKARLDLLEE